MSETTTLLQVLTSIVVVVLIILMPAGIISGCASKRASEIYSNDALPSKINEKLSSFSSTAKEISKNLVPSEESVLYDASKFEYLTINLNKDEFIFFFSKGTDGIYLKTYNGNKEVVSFKFIRPDTYECKLGACICSVRGMNLWTLRQDAQGKTEISIAESEIKNGFTLTNPRCQMAQKLDTQYINSRGFFTTQSQEYWYLDTTEFKNGFKSKLHIPLEILSLSHLSKLPESGLNKELAEKYLFSQYKNDVPNQEIAKYLLTNQKWEGGFVLGDSGQSLSGSVESYTESGNFNFFITKFKYEKPVNLVALNVGSPFSLTTKHVKEFIYPFMFQKIEKELNYFVKQGTASQASQKYSSLTDTKIFSKEFSKLFYTGEDMGEKPTIHITSVLDANKVPISSKFTLTYQTTQKTYDSDLKFIMPKDVTEICLDSIDARGEFMQFVSCDNKLYYDFSYSNTNKMITATSKENKFNDCYEYEITYYQNPTSTSAGAPLTKIVSYRNVDKVFNVNLDANNVCNSLTKTNVNQIINTIYFIDGNSIVIPDKITEQINNKNIEFVNCGFKSEKAIDCYSYSNLNIPSWSVLK